MAETVAHEMPSPAEIAACAGCTDAELAVYSGEYEPHRLPGRAEWYRCGTSGASTAELEVFAGRTIDVPSFFIAGAQRLGHLPAPGAWRGCRRRPARSMRGFHLVEGAGHWVQQEQPEEVSRLLLQFLKAS